ncbi:MAG: hypothetical protein KF802_12240 [Bdellovibrionaceae bacterium]|nr:hypothetical protein [Pseudobdellovibrionaceae bacterium]MBX2988657.1 hypothetical protein [Pseudobdellovibrionaceae bacterium]
MLNLKEMGREIDEILSSTDLSDEQKIKVSVILLNQETKNPKEMVPEELFRRAYYKTKNTDRNLIKIRGYISLTYSLFYNEFSKFSAIRIFRHISRFTDESNLNTFSVAERKQMREYIKRKFFINF